MLTTTKAIVINHVKFKDKSVVAKLYTNKYGLQSYIIHGVRGKKSKAALLQPLSLVEISFNYKENKTLFSAKELKYAESFSSIPFNIYKSTMAFYIADLLYVSIKEEEANKDMFEFIYNAILWLDINEHNYHNFHLYFTVQLTKYLGFKPQSITNNNTRFFFDLQEGVFSNQLPLHNFYVDQPLSGLIYELNNKPINEIGNLKINVTLKRNLLNTLLDYYSIHIGNFKALKSKEVLQEILS